ncbi:PKD domain-containing protein [Algoriphagus sediminis]|uniref:PKD domain-containing protein n=1 Tax=Algoriphagus sediminis TaxID=3057113 RepID=A0ABT7YDM2_9BACT|nr:PKD domain-containing protein [Algoriphagus sediminis]MDN3204624.1 PKD domain-containing protein [Algoriphagus sediminis]
MKKRLIKYVFLFGLIILPQIISAQVSTIGREFYIGFMDNNRRDSQPDRVVIFMTAVEKAAGTIQTPRQTITFDLEAGEQLIQEFDGDGEGLIHRGSGAVDFKPLTITSSGDLTVHALNGREYSSDGTVILPLNSLSSEYMVMAHYENFPPGIDPGSNQNFESTFLVMAVENNTEVEIIPAATTVNTIPAGAPIRITLNAGESYQIKAQADLSGSRVRVLNQDEGSCKLLAVFGGNKTSSAGDCGTSGDHIFQQAYPLDTWGKEYIHVPLAGRTSGEIVKVLASQDGTQVRINGSLEATLDAGEWTRFEFAKDELALIETSKPTSVAVIAKSAACNEFGVAPLGDPTLFLLTPNNQQIENITFSTGKLIGAFNQDIVHFLTVLVDSEAANQTVLNGQNIGGQFQPALNSGFSYAKIEVPYGVNSISNPEGLIGYVYGSGSIESYGFSIGSSLESIQFETESEYEFEVEGDRVACFNQEGLWTILPDNPEFNSFTWDFGDGSELKDGQNVAHTFTQTGTFEVKVFASTGEDRCDKEDEFTFEVEVKEVSGVISGPSSVCPDNGEITYEISEKVNFERAIWDVQGGDVIAETDSTITVDWVNSGVGLIEAIPLTDEGCYGDLLVLEVEVTEDIEPEAPDGSSGICDGVFNGLTYSVPFPLEGREYSWQITGGVIVSGQDTEQVTVDWDENSPLKQLFFTETSEFDASCSGQSAVLTVEIFGPVTIEENFFDPACSGDSDGIIEIIPSGGSGEFEYSWSHDPSLESGLAAGLSAGFYSVEVKDASGCFVESYEFTLVDPAPIRILSGPEILAPTCMGGNNGQIIVELSGGTGELQSFDFDSDWDGQFLTMSGFSAGPFSVFIQDEEGCGVSITGNIPEGQVIDLNFIEGSPSCPGAGDGELTVEVIGGVPPYTYLWEDGQTGSTASGLPSGPLAVTITDANGCIIEGIGEVSRGTPQVRMPTGFIPKDGLYAPIILCGADYSLMIWNRWGQLVYTGNEGWDGNISGEEAPSGVYSFKLEYEYQEGGQTYNELERGNFTLVR